MTSPCDGTELPAELTARPLALVALAGLDTVHNALHRTVWDAFAARRPDSASRAPLRCKLLPSTFELPVVKPKRTSYEWYIPKGILKKNWMPKRLSLVPAVIVVFYDMEWDEPQWNEKVLECASRVQSIRAACEGHGTRVAVVVLQGRPAPPPSEHAPGAERAQALCAACELPSKALFVLPLGGGALGGCVQRLEAALLDLAHSYYHAEGRAVRAHRDQLNKSTHQYLLVRHQFKLGFLGELKQDAAGALKHYQAAYGALLDVRCVHTNVHEVRTVAGYVHYKLCRLLLALNLPRDAVAQQRTHLERYRARSGPQELLFEHYAWLARQHAAFAELFDEAVRGGLPATRAQHPGLYWREAAALTARRRQCVRALSPAAEYPPAPDPLQGPVEYYGQRPWRPGRLGAEPPDPQREQVAVQALQARERAFEHSQLIVSLLGAAIAQYKTFHSPRTRRQLVVDMADEYFGSGDHGKALTLLTHVLPEYRAEGWRLLATRVQQRALHAAYLAARLHDYVPLVLHALAAADEPAERERLLGNVRALLALRPPAPEPGLAAVPAWTGAAAGEPRLLPVDMSAADGLLQVKVQWTQSVVAADQPAAAAVWACLRGPPLPIARASVALTAGARATTVPLTTEQGATSFTIQPQKLNKYACHLKTEPSDGACDLHINTVAFVLEPDDQRTIVLHFKTDESKAAECVRHPELLQGRAGALEALVARTVCSVRPRHSRLRGELQCAPPALMGDSFPVTLALTNHESCVVTRLTLTASLLPTPDNPEPETTAELSAGGGPLQLTAPATLAPGHSSASTFSVRCSRATPLALQVRAVYRLEGPSGEECTQTFTTSVAVVKPFDINTEFAALNFAPIAKCFVDVPFVVVPQISVLSPYELIIEHTALEPTDSFQLADEEATGGCAAGTRARHGQAVRDAVALRAVAGAGGAPRVGLYTVAWRRADGGATVRSSAPLGALAVSTCGVRARVRLAGGVRLQQRAQLSCWLQATGAAPLRLEVAVEGSDAFMVAGYRRRVLTLVPGADACLQYSLRALQPGPARPPALAATIVDPAQRHLQDDLTLMLSTIMPHTVFVMPDDGK